MFRPKGDTRIIQAKEDFNHETPLSTRVWLKPEVTDLAVKRLINAANMITAVDMPEHVQRYAIGRDLHGDPEPNRLFDELNNQISEQVNEIMSTWDQSQKRAFEVIKATKLPAMYIQGPPGTASLRVLQQQLKRNEGRWAPFFVTASDPERQARYQYGHSPRERGPSCDPYAGFNENSQSIAIALNSDRTIHKYREREKMF